MIWKSFEEMANGQNVGSTSRLQAGFMLHSQKIFLHLCLLFQFVDSYLVRINDLRCEGYKRMCVRAEEVNVNHRIFNESIKNSKLLTHKDYFMVEVEVYLL